AAKLGRRRDRRVGRGQRQVEEVRLAPPGRVAHVLDGLPRQRRQHVLRLEVGRGGAGAVLVERLGGGGQADGVVVLDEAVGRHVQRRGDAEEVIEPAGGRAVADRLAEVHLWVAFAGVRKAGGAHLCRGRRRRPVPPQVPLADGG